MIRVADAIESALDQVDPRHEHLLQSVIDDHLPDILLERAQDRLADRMPAAYRRWIIAKALAARIVYREGIEAVEAVEAESIFSLAVEFLHREHEREQLAQAVEGAAIDCAADIADLLRNTSILASIRGRKSEQS